MQPLHSCIISIPGSTKTWTWKLSPILVSKITENHKIMPKVGPRRLPKSRQKSVDPRSKCILDPFKGDRVYPIPLPPFPAEALPSQMLKTS